MKEIWKDIVGYENIYQISNNGNVKSLGRWINTKCKGKRWQEGKILKPNIDNRGYLHVCLMNNGIKKTYSVHRLVAQAFISNPNNYPCVNHKDENKQNNCVENLEFCTVKYNVNYGTRNERAAGKQTNGKLSKQVLQIDIKTGEIIRVFPSVSEVQRQLGVSISHISECCNNKPNHNTVGGFKWAFKKGDY